MNAEVSIEDELQAEQDFLEGYYLEKIRMILSRQRVNRLGVSSIWEFD